MARCTTSPWRSSKKGTWLQGSLRRGYGKRGSRSGGTGGSITREAPKEKDACSNLRPVSLTRIFHVPGIELAGNQPPELLGKRRDVVQHRPEMAGASGHDEEVPQLVEPEYSGHQVGPLQSVDKRSCSVEQSPAQDPAHPAGRDRQEEGGSRDHR